MDKYPFIKICLTLLAVLLVSLGDAAAYGIEGHALVGAVADARLAGTPAGAQVTAFINGLTLSRAAVIPDQIKAWDKFGADAPGGFSLPEYPEIEKQLREFWKANPPPPIPRSDNDTEAVPSHHWFHYTDIPIVGHDRYNQGKYGRSQWDVVQMISYCTAVLRGSVPEENPRKITKAIAIILLAHYVGDIHQPLHVGAQFFDQQGRPIDPDAFGVRGALEDQGGNTLFLILKQPVNPGESSRPVTLHGFWDRSCAMAAIARIGEGIKREQPAHGPDFTPQEIAARLIIKEPPNWNFAAADDVSLWSERWANALLPLAREAHDRLSYSKIEPKEEHGSMVAAGFVKEKTMPDGKSYAEWSGQVVADQLAKAGWRLAALLEKALAPP